MVMSLGAQGFKSSWGLALDPQGNIHDAGRGYMTIKVFTPEGTYVRSYGDVNQPSGIAIDDISSVRTMADFCASFILWGTKSTQYAILHTSSCCRSGSYKW